MNASRGMAVAALVATLGALLLTRDRFWRARVEEHQGKVEILGRQMEKQEEVIRNLRAENDQLRSGPTEIHRLRAELQRLLQVEREFMQMRSKAATVGEVARESAIPEAVTARTAALEALATQERAAREQIVTLEFTLNGLLESSGMQLDQLQAVPPENHAEPRYRPIFNARRDLETQKRHLETIKLRILQEGTEGALE